MKYYEKAIDLNHPRAFNNLAKAYLEKPYIKESIEG